jgi:hypothetical protein
VIWLALISEGRARARATSRSSSHGSGEADKDVTAAGRRNVGEDLAAAAGHEPSEGLGLNADPAREDSATFILVLDSNADCVLHSDQPRCQ